MGRARIRRRAITASTSEALGSPVAVAVPLQRHPPQLILVACGLELAALAALGLTGSLAAFAALCACAAGLVALGATNRRRILALTSAGPVVLDATLRREPVASRGPAPPRLALPAPTGVGCPVQLDDGRWWVDRSDYARLRRAREVMAATASAVDPR